MSSIAIQLVALAAFSLPNVSSPDAASISAARASLRRGVTGIAAHNNPGDAHHLVEAAINAPAGAYVVVEAWYMSPAGPRHLQLFPHGGNVWSATLHVSYDPASVASDSALLPNVPVFAPTQYTVRARTVRLDAGVMTTLAESIQVVVP